MGVFANTIYSIDGSKYLKEPILKIMLIYKSLLWILNKIQVQNAATSCIRLMGKNIFFLTGMEEIFKIEAFYKFNIVIYLITKKGQFYIKLMIKKY